MIARKRGLSQTPWLVMLVLAVSARAGTPSERLERADAQPLPGRLAADSRGGFVFLGDAGTKRVALEPGSVVRMGGAEIEPALARPPFRVLVGETLRLSGMLVSMNRERVVLHLNQPARDVVLARPGVQAVIQRPGEARVLGDGFDRLDPARWVKEGGVGLVEAPSRTPPRALRVPSAGGSVVAKLDQPVAAGQVEVSYFDTKVIAPDRRAVVEATFQGPNGPSSIRVVLGWSEETLAVESPDGPALAVQRLPRVEGWHRLTIRFDDESTEISVDGKELAHGKGPSGPCSAIKLAARAEPEAKSSLVAAVFDDVQVVRFAEPPSGMEPDVAQDEARLITGDELYGELDRGDGDGVVMNVAGGPTLITWAELAGVYFRREPGPGSAVEGLLVRVTWRSAPGSDLGDVDFAEGALTGLDSRSLTLATPYAGTLVIPRERVLSVAIQGRGRRIVIDPAAHHLGDELSVSAPILDPPQPEGGTLERSFELADLPSTPAVALLDMVQVVGEDNDAVYSRYVREGELRTWLVVNGQRVDYVNRFIKTRGETPERIAVPIPCGLLKAGRNTIRLELTGMARKAKELDDLGVLHIAVEFREPPAPAIPGP